jgi:putative addiction module killer protein
MEILMTVRFTKWLLGMKDGNGRSRIVDRVDRLAQGNPGDSRSVGGGVVELKIDAGPGYRVYYVARGLSFILLPCGGDKTTQNKDIELAKILAANFRSRE